MLSGYKKGDVFTLPWPRTHTNAQTFRRMKAMGKDLPIKRPTPVNYNKSKIGEKASIDDKRREYYKNLNKTVGKNVKKPVKKGKKGGK